MFERLSGSHLAGPCEESFSGCTKNYKKKFGAAWKHGAALGFTNPFPVDGVLPSWSPATWNSVCISASASLELFSININDGEIRQSPPHHCTALYRPQTTDH